MEPQQFQILILSDIHYAGLEESRRVGHEARAIGNPLLRLLARAYRHCIWLRDPFAHNHLLDEVLSVEKRPDMVVVNGDLSCDTAFIGHSDEASFQSATECLRRLRFAYGDRVRATYGDHELGKASLFGGRGGLRCASWDRCVDGLAMPPFWSQKVGLYHCIGVASSLVALPVNLPETLESERSRWRQLRSEHMTHIRAAFGTVRKKERLLLFCHDPTALPFLLELPEVAARLHQIERTVIGHLHSKGVMRLSFKLAGLPSIGFLGRSVHRMSSALHQARLWEKFNVLLCPSLSGIQLLKDGGYWRATIDLTGRAAVVFDFHPLHWR